MRNLFRRNYTFLSRPLSLSGRVFLLLAVVCLVLAAVLPVWRITLVAPQYEEGLNLQIYAYQLVAGNNGVDLSEINNLNHYIGMKPISEADFIEMRWVPFTMGIFVMLALRAAAIGTMRSLTDLMALFLYFTAFSFGSFYYRLYTYGHHLDPTAPVRIEPFTPILIGRQQIANFQQSSWPEWGALFFALFPILVVLAMWSSRKETPL